MRIASLILLATLTFAGQAFGQLKIGYADIQAVLSRMPETQTMQQQLSVYEQKLTESLQVKQQYGQTKLQEYMEMREGANPDQAQLAALEAELQQLDQDISKSTSDAEAKLMTRRQELLQPVIDKLQAAIDSVATENGYDFIVSKVDGTGSTMVLYGPTEDDVTIKLMQKLNIPVQTTEGE